MVALTKAVLLATISSSALAQNVIQERSTQSFNSLLQDLQRAQEQAAKQSIHITQLTTQLQPIQDAAKQKQQYRRGVGAGAGTVAGVYDQEAAAAAKQAVDAANARLKMTKVGNGNLSGLIKARNAQPQWAGFGITQALRDQQAAGAAKALVDAELARQKMTKGSNPGSIIKARIAEPQLAGAGVTQALYDQQAAAAAKSIVDAMNARQKMTKGSNPLGLIKARNAEPQGAGITQAMRDQQAASAARTSVNAQNARQKMTKGGNATGLIKARHAVPFTA